MAPKPVTPQPVTTAVTGSDYRLAAMPDDAVTVVLPCLNEEESLPAVLAAIPAGYRALVVDNNSTDDTAGVAAPSRRPGGRRTAARVRVGGARGRGRRDDPDRRGHRRRRLDGCR